MTADTVRQSSRTVCASVSQRGVTTVSLPLLALVAAVRGRGRGPLPPVPLLPPQRGPFSEQSLAGVVRWEVIVVVAQVVVLETGARVFVHVDDAFLQVSLVT